MSAWPTDDLTNTHLDASSDDPALGRAELNALLLKVQSMLAARNDNSGICGLDSNGAIAFAQSKIIFGEVDDTPSAVYLPSGWTVDTNDGDGLGQTTIHHNLGHYNYGIILTAANESYSGYVLSTYQKYQNSFVVHMRDMNNSTVRVGASFMVFDYS